MYQSPFCPFLPINYFLNSNVPNTEKGGVLCMGAAEEDSFSFQPIGGPKVPCFYSFQITGG
jgi:hypothetical protein